MVQFACALAMTLLLAYMLRKGVRTFRGVSDGWMAFGIFLYLGTVTMWGLASFSFAKAKGYSSDQTGAILIFLFILAFCFPVAAFVLPAVVIGLKDKTHARRRH